MYASAMKFCGAMELCGIGYPTSQPIDHDWPAVLKQIDAQGCGLVVAITRGHKPAEAEFMIDKGFAPVYQFENPRTGTIATMWIKDFTKEGQFKTELPPQIVVQARGAPTAAPIAAPTAGLSSTAAIRERARCLDAARQVIDAEVVSETINANIRAAQEQMATPRWRVAPSRELENVDTATWIPYTGTVTAASSPAVGGPTGGLDF